MVDEHAGAARTWSGAMKPAHGKAEAETWNVVGAIVEAPARPQFETDCQIERPSSCGAQ